jgi:hypothetical protein
MLGYDVIAHPSRAFQALSRRQRKIRRHSLLQLSWLPVPQTAGAQPMQECRIIAKTDTTDRNLCHVYRTRLKIIRKGKKTGPVWEFTDMPEELANLCRLVVRDGADGPWQQIGSWILQNEDFVPKPFWRAFIETVNSSET